MTSAFTNSTTCCGRGLSMSRFETGCCTDPKRFKPEQCRAALRMCGDGNVCAKNSSNAKPDAGFGTIQPGNFLHYGQTRFDTRQYVAPLSGCPKPCSERGCDDKTSIIGPVCLTPSNSNRPLMSDCCPSETYGGSCQGGSTMIQIVETENALRYDPAYEVTPGMNFLQQYF
jgi:hypothetical protein